MEKVYSIRGIVESGIHIHESGLWIFKKHTPVVLVHLNEKQLAVLNEMTSGSCAEIDSVLEVEMLDESRDYMLGLMGTEVCITICYTSPLERFFMFPKAFLKVTNIQAIDTAIQFENEIKVPA